MKKVLQFALATAVLGVMGWRVIRFLSREEGMENLRKLFGDDWFKREILAPEPDHLLGEWHEKNADNPVTKYCDDLVGYALKGDSLKCDVGRLATKIEGRICRYID